MISSFGRYKADYSCWRTEIPQHPKLWGGLSTWKTLQPALPRSLHSKRFMFSSDLKEQTGRDSLKPKLWADGSAKIKCYTSQSCIKCFSSDLRRGHYKKKKDGIWIQYLVALLARAFWVLAVLDMSLPRWAVPLQKYWMPNPSAMNSPHRNLGFVALPQRKMRDQGRLQRGRSELASESAQEHIKPLIYSQ